MKLILKQFLNLQFCNGDLNFFSDTDIGSLISDIAENKNHI